MTTESNQKVARSINKCVYVAPQILVTRVEFLSVFKLSLARTSYKCMCLFLCNKMLWIWFLNPSLGISQLSTEFELAYCLYLASTDFWGQSSVFGFTVYFSHFLPSRLIFAMKIDRLNYPCSLTICHFISILARCSAIKHPLM